MDEVTSGEATGAAEILELIMETSDIAQEEFSIENGKDAEILSSNESYFTSSSNEVSNDMDNVVEEYKDCSTIQSQEPGQITRADDSQNVDAINVGEFRGNGTQGSTEFETGMQTEGNKRNSMEDMNAIADKIHAKSSDNVRVTKSIGDISAKKSDEDIQLKMSSKSCENVTAKERNQNDGIRSSKDVRAKSDELIVVAKKRSIEDIHSKIRTPTNSYEDIQTKKSDENIDNNSGDSVEDVRTKRSCEQIQAEIDVHAPKEPETDDLQTTDNEDISAVPPESDQDDFQSAKDGSHNESGFVNDSSMVNDSLTVNDSSTVNNRFINDSLIVNTSLLKTPG